MTSLPRPTSDPDQRIFTFADIKKLFKRQKKKIFRAMIFGAILGFGAKLIMTPVQYEVISTFREGVSSSNDEASKFLGLLGTKTADSQTIVLIQSICVLKPLVQRMGVQATVSLDGKISRLFRRMKDNLLAEMGKEVKDKEAFSFRNVIYEGEKAISYELYFETPDQFSVLSGKEVLGVGSVGSKVSIPGASFTLVKTPRSLRLKHRYTLCLQTSSFAVDQILPQLSVTADKLFSSVYRLSFSHRDRFYGVEILEQLLEEYRTYLKQDHDEAMREQLAYLGQRQEEIYGSLSQVFDEYLQSMQRSLNDAGQIDFSQEIRSTGALYQDLAKKSFVIDVELDQLDFIEKEQKIVVPMTGSPFFNTIAKVLQEISELKQNRDWIELTLHQNEAKCSEIDYEISREELKKIRKEREMLRSMLESIDKGMRLEVFEPEKALPFWADSLNRRIQYPEDKEELVEYLEHYSRLLSMQENIVLQRISQETPSEFKGIDLQTSQTLFLSYNQKLDESSALAMQYARLCQEIVEDDFEVSSLGVVLQDPLSRRLVDRAVTLAVQLKDEKHRSERESDRWKEELLLHKKILKDHLDQLHKMEDLKSELFRQKIAILQRLTLNSILGQISILREKFSDLVKEHRSSLAIEKKSYEKKMEEIREHFVDFPEKWRQERWIDWKSNMGLKMMGAITELVETRTISSNLHRIATKPLNPPVTPLAPKPPKLFMTAILGAILATVGLFSHALFRTILKGFPSSTEKLYAMQYPVLGEISSHADGEKEFEGSDLEILRRISLFIDQSPKAETIALIAAQGPDYSYALADLLAKISKKVIIVRCDFREKFHESQMPGLLQIWKGEVEEVPLHKKEAYSYLFSGGFTPYGAEVIRSEKFSQLLNRLKQDYEVVLVLLRTPIHSTENLAVLSLADKAVVTVSGEPTEQLTPFIHWGYHEESCSIAFITRDFA